MQDIITLSPYKEMLVFLCVLFVIFVAVKFKLFSFLSEVPESLEKFILHFVDYRLGYLQTVAILITSATVTFLVDTQSSQVDNVWTNIILAVCIPVIGYFNMLLAFEVGHNTIPDVTWDDWLGRFVSLTIAAFILYCIHSIMFMKYGLAANWGECSINPWADKNIYKLYSLLDYNSTIKFVGVILENLIAIIISITPRNKKNGKVKDKDKDKKVEDKKVEEKKEDKKVEEKKEDSKPVFGGGQNRVSYEDFVPGRPMDATALHKDERTKWMQLGVLLNAVNNNPDVSDKNKRIEIMINKAKDLGLSKYLDSDNKINTSDFLSKPAPDINKLGASERTKWYSLNAKLKSINGDSSYRDKNSKIKKMKEIAKDLHIESAYL